MSADQQSAPPNPQITRISCYGWAVPATDERGATFIPAQPPPPDNPNRLSPEEKAQVLAEAKRQIDLNRQQAPQRPPRTPEEERLARLD